MTYSAHIIQKFGGIRPMAAALSVPPSTVQHWKDAGHIPARRQGDVLSAAQRLGLDVSPADFFDQPKEAA